MRINGGDDHQWDHTHLSLPALSANSAIVRQRREMAEHGEGGAQWRGWSVTRGPGAHHAPLQNLPPFPLW